MFIVSTLLIDSSGLICGSNFDIWYFSSSYEVRPNCGPVSRQAAGLRLSSGWLSALAQDPRQSDRHAPTAEPGPHEGYCHLSQVVYITATFPFVMLIVLLIRGVTLPGASEGIKFYLYPDLDRLKDPEVSVPALQLDQALTFRAPTLPRKRNGSRNPHS